MRFPRFLPLPLLALVAGCATHKPVIVAQTTPPPVPQVEVAPQLPAGASPGMLVPTALADGSFPTPNRALSGAATLWHLRAGLNVAALSCQSSPAGDAIVSGYNALIVRHKTVLATAESSYAAEYRAGGGTWRDRYDDAMTRLYNFFSQTPARHEFCTAAASVLSELATAPAGGLESAARDELAALDRPFTDFYRAYDAWRRSRMQMVQLVPNTRPVIAVAAGMQSPAGSTPATITATAPAGPRLAIDPSVFGVPETTP